MTPEQKIAMVQALLDNDTSATGTLVAVYLAKAGAAVLRRLYPFGLPDGASVPAEYEVLQCELASRFFLRRGAEGEVAHDENGINRTYGSVNDEDLLSEIVPFARMV